MKKKILLSCVLLVIAYFSLTWFSFGSPHPCRILEARQRPHLIRKARADSNPDRELAYKLMKSLQPQAMEAGTSILETLNDQPRRVASALKQRIASMTPAECAWQAITWRIPSEGSTY